MEKLIKLLPNGIFNYIVKRMKTKENKRILYRARYPKKVVKQVPSLIKTFPSSDEELLTILSPFMLTKCISFIVINYMIDYNDDMLFIPFDPDEEDEEGYIDFGIKYKIDNWLYTMNISTDGEFSFYNGSTSTCVVIYNVSMYGYSRDYENQVIMLRFKYVDGDKDLRALTAALGERFLVSFDWEKDNVYIILSISDDFYGVYRENLGKYGSLELEPDCVRRTYMRFNFVEFKVL